LRNGGTRRVVRSGSAVMPDAAAAQVSLPDQLHEFLSLKSARASGARPCPGRMRVTLRGFFGATPASDGPDRDGAEIP